MKKKTLFWIQMSLFVAIEIVFCFTVLGSIPISPGIVATLAHIPALIAALVLGKKAGAIVGAVMGISSLIIWTFMPPNPFVAFAFSPFAPNGNIWSLLISVVPRTVFPIFAAWIFEILRKRIKPVLSASISAASATLLHSLLVLSGIFFAFTNNEVVGGSYTNFLVAWGGLNAIIEIVVAAILVSAIALPLLKIYERSKSSSGSKDNEDKLKTEN